MKSLDPITSRSLSLVGWLAASWVVLLVLGYSALRVPGALAAGNPVSADRAAFTSASAATLTGFEINYAHPHDFVPTVQAIFAFQTVSGALLSLIGGGVLTARLLGLPHSDSRIALTSLMMLVVAAAIGASTLGQGDGVAYAAFRGIGAMSCTGLLFGNIPSDGNPALLLALFPLSVVGSLGAVFVLELKDWITRRVPMHFHVRAAAALAGVVYIVGTLIGWLMVGDPTRASAIALSARGYGLPVDFANDAPRALAWWVMAIAAVGPGTAGTAGGFGVGYLVTFRARHLSPVLLGVAVQAGVVLVALLALLQTELQLAPDRVATVTISAATGVGLSHDPVSITRWGLAILTALMIAGRVIPLLVLAQMLRKGLGSHGAVTQAIVDN